MIFDGLIRIQNGYIGDHKSVVILGSKFMQNILLILRSEGLIQGFSVFNGNGNIKVLLNRAIMLRIKFISKDSCRKFVSYRGVCKKYVSSRNISVVSTSCGLYTSKFITINRLGIGGELLFDIYVSNRVLS